MTATAGTAAGSGARYLYRADGMRAEKIEDITLSWVENPNVEDGSGFYDPIYSTNKPTRRYFYDGQMCVEEDYIDEVGYSVDTEIKKYGIGARGIDSIELWTEGNYQGIQFPLYDAHGNMTETLARTGSGTTYSRANKRSYDAWGDVDLEQSVQANDPSQRYCANLGHVQDDESDLIYMRARYYEPWTGRFLSQDPARDGKNWLVYCDNEPNLHCDPSGQSTLPDLLVGAWEEAIEKFREAQQANVTFGWAQNAIHRALTKWSEKVGPELLEAMYGETFKLELGRLGGIQLTGVAGRYTIGIVTVGQNIVVKTYDSFGKHVIDNVIIPFEQWWH